MQYYAKRFGQFVGTIYAVITISFFLVRFMPGGPLDYLRAQLAQTGTTSQQRQERINHLAKIYLNINPSEPLWKQYLNYLISISTGDLGRSMWFNKPVADILAPAIPWTVFIMSSSLLVSFTTGIALGSFMAYVEGSWIDGTLTTVLLWSHAIPYYLAALALLFVFGYELEWFPTGGRMGPNVYPGINLPFLVSVMKHAALPLISLIITQWGSGALQMRGNSIQILGSDYLRVGRLRGISTSRLSLFYVTRNAVLPMYTSLLIQIGFVLGGSVILETIFAYPGMGFYLFRGFEVRDYPLMMAGFLLITIAVATGILIGDLTYGLIDPRVSTRDSHESF